MTAPPSRTGRQRLTLWLALVLLLAGAAVLIYPVGATQYNNLKQREFAAQYSQDIASAAPDAMAQDIAAAHTYNATLDGVPILDPWLTRVSSDPQSGPYRAYLGLLSRFDVMGRLQVPAAHIDLPINHGTSDEVLAQGVGHLYGTSLPVGGPSTHAVLTAHTGMATATLFDHLTSLRSGDLMLVTVGDQTLAYSVDSRKIVLPNQIDDLKVVQGKDLLTLLTCYPYAINTHRLLVTGHRVPYTPTLAAGLGVPDTTALESWMVWCVAGAAIGLLAFLGILGREAHQARRRALAMRARP